MNKQKIRIDIVSDVVCPWCYIGKVRLEKAIRQLNNEFDFELFYHPFELNPNVPKEGLDQKKYLIQKFGGEERYFQLTQHVTNIAIEEGLQFNYEIQKQSPNTFDAHRIIWLAGKQGKQLEVVEGFFKAYFVEGVDLSQQKNLISIAAKAGLDAEEINDLIQSDKGVKEVRKLQSFNPRLGITGVPFYIFNEKYSLSGAHPSEVFEKLIRQISSTDAEQGSVCDLDGNC